MEGGEDGGRRGEEKLFCTFAYHIEARLKMETGYWCSPPESWQKHQTQLP